MADCDRSTSFRFSLWLLKGAACVCASLRLGLAVRGAGRRAALLLRAVGWCALAPEARALLRWVMGACG